MLKILVILLGVTIAELASAESVQDYCNDLYPVDGYDAEDRQVYIKECVEMYAEDFAQQAETSAITEALEESSEPGSESDMDMEESAGYDQ